MDRCTGCHDITEILLKTELNTMHSINQKGHMKMGKRCQSSVLAFQKLVLMDPDQALRDMGIKEYSLRFTSTLYVDDGEPSNKLAEKIYTLVKG